jgi:hypothetical protein
LRILDLLLQTLNQDSAFPWSATSDETHVDNVTRPAATRTALGAASAFGPSR